MYRFLLLLFALFAIAIAGIWLLGGSDDRADPMGGLKELATDAHYPADLITKGPKGQTKAVIAKSVGIVVKGAIICSNYAQVSAVFHLYNNAWEQQMQDRFSGGQSVLMRGKAAENPNAADYGCVLIAPGTVMKKENARSVVPIVDVTMHDGTILRGVTLSGMIEDLEQPVPLSSEPPSTSAETESRTPPNAETPSINSTAVAPANDSSAPPLATSWQELAPPVVIGWRTERNGDITLSGPKGICATISLLQQADPAVRLTFEDGPELMFNISDTPKAIDAGRQHCSAATAN